MYTNPFNRKHSTIRQVLDRILDPGSSVKRKPIQRSESVSSSGSSSSKGSTGSLGTSSRGILQWGRK